MTPWSKKIAPLGGQSADRTFGGGTLIPGLFASPDQDAALVAFAGDQLPLRDRPQLAKHLLETLRRVRIIDDHGEGLTEVDPLHSTAHPAEVFEPVTDLVEAQTNRDPGRRGRQRVGRIPSATQLES